MWHLHVTTCVKSTRRNILGVGCGRMILALGSFSESFDYFHELKTLEWIQLSSTSCQHDYPRAMKRSIAHYLPIKSSTALHAVETLHVGFSHPRKTYVGERGVDLSMQLRGIRPRNPKGFRNDPAREFVLLRGAPECRLQGVGFYCSLRGLWLPCFFVHGFLL